jgi:hypothetical protein
MLSFNSVQFCDSSLSLLRFLEVFGKILVSFGLVQILGISDFVMAKNKKVNIAVTYILNFATIS